MEVSEHGGEVRGAEACEVGGTSCAAFCIAEREGVGDGDAWFDETEEPGSWLGGVRIEHASEEVDVVRGPCVCVCDECIECVVTAGVGTCDEKSEGVLTRRWQRKTEGERAAGGEQQEPLSFGSGAPGFGRGRQIGGGGARIGAGGGARSAWSEGEKNHGGGEVAESVGKAEAELPRCGVAIVEEEARERRRGPDDGYEGVLGSAFIFAGAEFVCGGRGRKIRGTRVICAEDFAGRNLGANSGVGCERC